MQAPEPQDGHRWLHQLVGEWTFSHSGNGETVTGTERVSKLGELWIVGEQEMLMPGGAKGNALITLGYDPEKKRFPGTWVGSMMTHLWVYDGELSSDGKMLSLYADGPSFDEKGNFLPGKTSRYRDAIEVHEDGTRTFSGSMLNEDGTWKAFMTSHYRRKG